MSAKLFVVAVVLVGLVLSLFVVAAPKSLDSIELGQAGKGLQVAAEKFDAEIGHSTSQFSSNSNAAANDLLNSLGAAGLVSAAFAGVFIIWIAMMLIGRKGLLIAAVLLLVAVSASACSTTGKPQPVCQVSKGWSPVVDSVSANNPYGVCAKGSDHMDGEQSFADHFKKAVKKVEEVKQCYDHTGMGTTCLAQETK